MTYTSAQFRGILTGFDDLYGWKYEETEHPCPTCGKHLTLVVDSTMLVCENKEHGPFFLA